MSNLYPSNESVKELVKIICGITDERQCVAFLEDLCTAQELRLLAQRLQVAKCLINGETYDTIRSKLPVSHSTITRVNTALQYGGGGYRSVLSDRIS